MVEQLIQSIGGKDLEMQDGMKYQGFRTFTFNNDKKRGKAKNVWAAGIVKGTPYVIHDNRIRIDKFFDMIEQVKFVLPKLTEGDKQILVALNGRFFLDHIDNFLKKGQVNEIFFLYRNPGMDSDDLWESLKKALN